MAADSAVKAPAESILSDHRTWRFLESFILLALGWNLWSGRAVINHDCAMYSRCAQLILEGQVPYVDFVELNPPAIMYLNVPHVAVAKWLGIDPRITFLAFVWLLVVGSTAAIVHFLSRMRPALLPAEIGVCTVLWLAATYRCGDDFGQREHIFMLACGPLLILRIARRQGALVVPLLALAVGVAAGAAASVKPYFVILVTLVELILLVQNRDWKSLLAPEILGFAAIIIAYACHWILVPAAMRQQFFERWVPMVLRDYKAYASPFGSVVLAKWLATLLAWIAVSTVVIASFWFARARFLRSPMLALTAGMVGAYAFFLWQKKGWAYQVIPFNFFAFLICALAYGQFIQWVVRTARSKWLRGAVVAMPFIAGIALAGLFPWRTHRPVGRALAELEQVVLRNTQPREPVIVLSTSVAEVFPMLFSVDRRSGSRYLWHFPIALCYSDIDRSTSASKLDYIAHCRETPDEQEYLAELQQDLNSRRPRLVFVRDAEDPLGCPQHFNLYAYLHATGIIAVLRDLGYQEEKLQNDWSVFVANGNE